jgi:uncharacterized protein (DUF952 family)/GNAT superfamily N-acetyltransferase
VTGERIFHLALVEDWQRDLWRDYTTSTLGRDLADVGFIHCSFAGQVQGIADLVYRGREDVVLLEIDPDRVRAPLHVESLEDGGEEFPHIYGALNREAVTRFTPLSRHDDGTLDAESIAKPARSADTATISVLRTEDLTATQRSSVIDVCMEAHDNDDFLNLFTHIAGGGRHFLAYRGAELVSHAVVTARWLQADRSRLLRTAYVDAVSTLPARQHHGYATTVMRRLADEIDDFEIGCLQTDRPTFYERLGWFTWPGPLAGRSDAGLIPTPDQRGVMVLCLRTTPPLDRSTQLSIECQAYRIWE